MVCAMSPLPLTGERTVPGVPEENYWFRRHEAAYQHLAPLAAGRIVLEVGCGEGYGTAVLARHARRVVGVDYDALTIAHAAGATRRLGFVRANLAALPMADGHRDLVATLQVIEHVWNHREFVRECRRVLRPGGQLIVTTPNRLTFSPGLDEPLNPFHTKEFTAAELSPTARRRRVRDRVVAGAARGPTAADLDARYGWSKPSSPSRPSGGRPQLLADVAAVTTGDFEDRRT